MPHRLGLGSISLLMVSRISMGRIFKILMLWGIKIYCSIRRISTAGLESMPGLRSDSLPQASIGFDLANAFQSECVTLQYLSNPE